MRLACEHLENGVSPRAAHSPYIQTARGRPASRRIPSPPECLPRVTTLAAGGEYDERYSASGTVPQLRRYEAFMILGRRDRFGRHRSQAAAETLRDEIAAKSAMALPRWTLTQALAWVATRNPDAVVHGAIGTRLSVWMHLHPGQYPCARNDEAWAALANAVAVGELAGIGTQTTQSRTAGLEREKLGVRFPPLEQPGLLLTCHLSTDGKLPIVRPNDHHFYAQWWEFKDLTFARADVMAAFPLIDDQTNRVGAIEAPVAPEGTCTTHVPPEPSQVQQFRPGSQAARVSQLIAEAFPRGVGQIADSAIRAALRSKFNDADRDIQDHTIRRAINAARAADLA